MPNGSTVVSRSVMSLAYVTMHACRVGSSGSVPSARIHTFWPSAGRPALAARRIVVDVADVDRSRPLVPLAHPLPVRRHARLEVGQRVGRRDVRGHRDLVVGSGLAHVEARLQVEDRTAVLDRDHAAGDEALAVADPVDLVQDRDRRVAGTQEVRVQRVDEPIRLVDRARARRRAPAPPPGRRTPAGGSRPVTGRGRC